MVHKIAAHKNVKVLTKKQQQLIKGGGIIIPDLTMT